EENKPRFSKLVLSDIAIHLVLTSVHTGQIGNLIRIVLWAIDSPDRDKDSEELDATDSIVEYYKVPVAAKYYREINCDQTGCLLKDWNFYMCYQFSKDEQKVCILLEEDDTDSIIFDTANFALILVVDYMSRFFKMRRLHNKIPPPDAQNPNQQDSRYLTNNNIYFLGQNFLIQARQTGLPVYFSDGVIEIAYKYDVNIKNIHKIANIIAQQIIQAQQGENSEIENEAFISNLLDGKSLEVLITNDFLLTEQQKNQLHILRKQRIQNLTDKVFDELKNNIKNEKILSKLEDKGYYDNRIEERIALLRQPPSPKRLAENEDENKIYLSTRIIDNAKPNRNYNGNDIAQIS
ncbi:36151_t:CDS:2, partial [Racocetra persica]